MKYFLPALGLLFIGLKLTGYITWSWWLVTLPLWGGLAALLVFLLVLLAIAVATGTSTTWRFK